MNVLLRRAVTLALAVTVLVPILPGVAPRAQTAPDPGGGQPGERVELEGRRTQNSKTFRNADGTLTTVVFGSPVHFETPGGDWREIDSGVRPADTPGYALRNGANAFDALFGETARDAFLKLDLAGESFSFELPGAAGTPARARAKGVSYDEILPGVAMDYDLLAEGLKQTLVLEGPHVPTRYRFTMTADSRAPVAVAKQHGGAWAVYTSKVDPAPIADSGSY